MTKIKKSFKKGGWKPVRLEGPIVSDNLEGLIGIEELHEYDFDTVNKGRRKNVVNIPINKKKHKAEKLPKLKASKVSKIGVAQPGAFVRNPNYNPQTEKTVPVYKSRKTKPVKLQKKRKTEIGQVQNEDEKSEKCTVEDLHAWSFISLPDPILKALADLKFITPTPIQELTLPASILGRRDILGAAETGSGKTLAFGLPILSGILKLKEKAAQKSSFDDDEEELKENDDENMNSDEDVDDNSDGTNSENEELVESAESNIEEEDAEENADSDDGNEEENDGTANESSEESDFEEKEEAVEGVGVNGVGCVRSIDNIQFSGMMKRTYSCKPLYALIITPTRELAIQIKNHLIAIAKYTDIRVAVILGGMAAVKQERILSKGPEIVVATPGRLWELIQQGNPHLSQLDTIKFLAIDETDRMIEKYHFQELNHILERLNMDEDKRKQRQNFVFSATLTMVHDLPRYLVRKKKAKYNSKIHKLTPDEKIKNIIELLGISNPKIVDVTKDTSGTSTSLTECRINCGLEEKDHYLYYFLQKHPGRTLIFCNSIGCVKRLATLLNLLDCTALPLHATMQQRQRLKNLERFRDDTHGILVATDVAARGLDIPCVEHVIHYQTPRTSEGYVHRSGRTARARKEGITVLLIEPNEVSTYVKLCSTLGREDDLPHFPIIENLLAAVKQRVNLARKLDKLELQTKRTSSETGWLQKAAKEMDIIIDEEDFTVDEDKEEKANLKRHTNMTRLQLKSLLAKQIFPRGFSANYPTSSGQLNIPMVQGAQAVEKAVDAMKNHLKNSAKNKKTRARKLFKKKVTNHSEDPKETPVSVQNNKNKIAKNKNMKKKFMK